MIKSINTFDKKRTSLRIGVLIEEILNFNVLKFKAKFFEELFRTSVYLLCKTDGFSEAFLLLFGG